MCSNILMYYFLWPFVYKKIKLVEITFYTEGRNLIKVFFTSDSMHRPVHLIQQWRWDLEEFGNIVTGSEVDIGYLVYSGGRNETPSQKIGFLIHDLLYPKSFVDPSLVCRLNSPALSCHWLGCPPGCGSTKSYTKKKGSQYSLLGLLKILKKVFPLLMCLCASMAEVFQQQRKLSWQISPWTSFGLPAEVQCEITTWANWFHFHSDPSVSAHSTVGYNVLSLAAGGLSQELI